MAPDMLTRIRGELEERMAALHPFLDEYHRLLAAADTLATVEAEVAASALATANAAHQVRDPPDVVGRARKSTRNTTGGTRRVRNASGDASRRAPNAPGGASSLRNTTDGTRRVREATDSTRPIHNALDGTRRMRETLVGTRPVRETLVGTRPVRETTDGTRPVREPHAGSTGNAPDGAPRARVRFPRGSAAGAIALAASPRDAIEQAAYLAEVIERTPSPDVIEQAATLAEVVEPAPPPIPSVPSTPSVPSPPKRKPSPRESDQSAILAALEHGSHTPGELAMVTAMSSPAIRTNLGPLLARGAIAKVTREGKVAYTLA